MFSKLVLIIKFSFSFPECFPEFIHKAAGLFPVVKTFETYLRLVGVVLYW